MSGPRCMLCGLPRIERHHPTRRATSLSPYLDSDLTIALCTGPPHSHHARVHESLRLLGLDLPPSGDDLLVYRLRTSAVHAGLAADGGHPFAVADAKASRGLQLLLLEAADSLEGTLPR